MIPHFLVAATFIVRLIYFHPVAVTVIHVDKRDEQTLHCALYFGEVFFPFSGPNFVNEVTYHIISNLTLITGAVSRSCRPTSQLSISAVVFS